MRWPGGRGEVRSFRPRSRSGAASSPSTRPSFTRSRPWRMAWISLIAAGEHLMIVRDTLAQKQLYPSGSYTVIRGALVGASQAVWALAPAVRELLRDRGLALIREMHTQLIKAHEDHDPTLLSSAQLTEIAEQIQWLKARRTTVTASMTSNVTINLTDIITAAADYLFKTPEKRQAARDLWRQMGGDAHVLVWPMLQRAEYRDRDRRTGLSTAEMAGGIPATANAYLGAFQILKAGWSLFDQRGEAG
jgi:hypothetical protein